MTDEALTKLDAAYACFRDVIAAGIEATLTSEFTTSAYTGFRPDFREGEFDIVIQTPVMRGLYHEQIRDVLTIAERHGARAWLGQPDRYVAILFPLDRAPDPEGEQETPRPKARRKAVA